MTSSLFIFSELIKELISRNSRDATCSQEITFSQEILCLFICCTRNLSRFELRVADSEWRFYPPLSHSQSSFRDDKFGSSKWIFHCERNRTTSLCLSFVGGFSRDDKPPKSVWLSTFTFFSSPSYVLISFSHALVSDCRLYSLSVIKRLVSFLFFFHSQHKSLIYIKEVKYISYLLFLL